MYGNILYFDNDDGWFGLYLIEMLVKCMWKFYLIWVLFLFINFYEVLVWVELFIYLVFDVFRI